MFEERPVANCMVNVYSKPSKWARNEKWIAKVIVKYIASRAKRYHEHWDAYGSGWIEGLAGGL
jgi:hypothetical protein